MAITHKIWKKNNAGNTCSTIADTSCMVVPNWAGKMLFTDGTYEQLNSVQTADMLDKYDYNLTDADVFITNDENSKVGIYCSGAPERLTAVYSHGTWPTKLFSDNDGIWSAEFDVTYSGVGELVPTSKESGTSQYSEYVEYNDGYRIDNIFDFNDLGSGDKVCTYGIINEENYLNKTGVGRFSGCTDLVSVKLLYSMNTISDGAFSGCTSFTGYSNPNYVKEIGVNAFSDCTALGNATLGRHLQTIGEAAYSGCTALTSVTFDGIEDINSSTYSRSRQVGFIPNWNDTQIITGETEFNTIPNKCFYGCTNLETTIFRGINYGGNANYNLITKPCPSEIIYFPGNIKEIGDEAFYGCLGLTGVSLNKVHTLGYHPFNNTNIELIDITPVSAMSSQVFSENTVLTAITVDTASTEINTLEYIPSRAFYKCTNLEYADFYMKSVETIRAEAFYGCTSLYSAAFTTPDGTGEVVLRHSAFYDCTSLTSIEVNRLSFDDVSGDSHFGHFYGCLSLTAIGSDNMIDGEYIFNESFYGCESLEFIKLSSECTSIRSSAFKDCYKLGDIWCYATTPPTVDTGAFENAGQYSPNPDNKCYLHVPASSIEAYKNDSGWQTYFTDDTCVVAI